MKIISETTSAPFSTMDTILIVVFMVAMIAVFCVMVAKLFKNRNPSMGHSAVIIINIRFLVFLIANAGCLAYYAISDNWPVYVREMWVTFDTHEDAEAVFKDKDYQVLNDSKDGIYHIKTLVKNP